MTTIYLVNKDTNNVVNTFTDVISWTDEYVLYRAGKGRGMMYASENEYITNIHPQELVRGTNEEEN